MTTKDGLCGVAILDELELGRGKHQKAAFSQTQMRLYGTITSLVGKHLSAAGVDASAGNGSVFFCNIEFSASPSAQESLPPAIADEAIGRIEVYTRFASSIEPNSVAGSIVFNMYIGLPQSDLSSLLALGSNAIRIDPVFHRQENRELTTERGNGVVTFYVERVYFTPILNTEESA